LQNSDEEKTRFQKKNEELTQQKRVFEDENAILKQNIARFESKIEFFQQQILDKDEVFILFLIYL
jgi:hypothetical protein